MHRRLILRAPLQIVPMQRLGEGEGSGSAGAGAGGAAGTGDTGTGGTPPAAAPLVVPQGEPESFSREYVEKLRREDAEKRVKLKEQADEIKALKDKDLSETEREKKRADDNEARAIAAETKARMADIRDAFLAVGCNPKKVHLYAAQVASDVTDFVVVAQQSKKDYPEDFRPQAPAPARTTGGQAAGAQDAGVGQTINEAIRQAARR